MQKREIRLKKARKVWELFLDEIDSNDIARELHISNNEVLSILNYTSPEFYGKDLSHILMLKLDNQKEEIRVLQEKLDNSRNMGWIPVSIGVFIASVAIIIALILVSV